MHVIDDEGVRYTEPKLKIVGLESVRSSTPYACRKALEIGYDLVLKGNKEELISFVDKFKKDFENLSFEQIAIPKGVNGMDKYEDENNTYKKGTPQHVKAALLFNKLLQKHNLANISPIWNGDKIKYFPLITPNPIDDKVIALPNDIPSELKYLKKYFDYDKQFEKTFFEPISTVTEAINWNISIKHTLDGFFQ